MNAIVRSATQAARSTNVGLWTACLTTATTVFLVTGAWAVSRIPLLSTYLQGLLVDLAVLGAVATLQSVAHAGGWVGAGTGAGLRLAALAVAVRAEYEPFLRAYGLDTWASVYDVLPSLGDRVWLVRNVSAVAFAYGLALTLFAVAVDAHRRRRHPAWVASLED